MSVLVGMLLAGCIAAVVGALVALRALRLGGIFLSLATFAFALFFDSVMVKFTWVSGGNGITPLKTPRPLLGPIDFGEREVVPRALRRDPRDRRGCSWCGCEAVRPVASSTRCAAARSRPRRLASTRPVAHHRLCPVGGLGRSRRWPAGDAGAIRELRNLLPRGARTVWVVVVVSLGSRTVEGAIQAAAGFIFFQRVVLESCIPWLFNNASGPSCS